MVRKSSCRKHLVSLVALSTVALAACAPAAPPSAKPAESSAVAPKEAVQSSAAAAAKPAATKPTFAAGTRMAMIQERGRLILGTKNELPGIGYLNPQSGKMEGFSVDLAEHLATKIFGESGRLEAKGATAQTRVPMVQEEIVDLNMETTFITQARREQVDFAEPYWGSGSRIFVKQEDNSINTLDDLNGKIVAVTKGSTTEREFRENWPQVTLLAFDTISDCVEAIRAGRAVATAFDVAIGLSIMKNAPGFKFVGDEWDYNYYGVMVKKGQPEWVAFLNDWLKEVKTDGTWKQLFAKSFPGSEVQDPPMPPYNKAFYE